MCLDRFTHPRKSKIYSSSQLEDLFVPPRGSSSLTTRPSYPIKVPVDCTPEDRRLGILSPSPGTRPLSKLPPRLTDEDRYRPTFGQGNILLPTRQSTTRQLPPSEGVNAISSKKQRAVRPPNRTRQKFRKSVGLVEKYSLFQHGKQSRSPCG